MNIEQEGGYRSEEERRAADEFGKEEGGEEVEARQLYRELSSRVNQMGVGLLGLKKYYDQLSERPNEPVSAEEAIKSFLPGGEAKSIREVEELRIGNILQSIDEWRDRLAKHGPIDKNGRPIDTQLFVNGESLVVKKDMVRILIKGDFREDLANERNRNTTMAETVYPGVYLESTPWRDVERIDVERKEDTPITNIWLTTPEGTRRNTLRSSGLR